MSNTEENLATEQETELLENQTEAENVELGVDELKVKLAQTQQAATEANDKMLRIAAEMDNLKRRTQKDVEDAHKFAISGFAKELLPVLDSLFMGLQLATGETEEVKKFREGCELTIKQFESAFEKFNVVTIDPINMPFNAEHHQAMMTQVVEGVEPNTVVNVFQKGYLLNGRLLRPAMVVVSKAAE